MVLRPISSHGIEQDVPHMNLVGIKVKSPDGPVVLYEENDVGNRPARDRHGEDVPHLAGIPSIAWSLELDLAQYPVPGILFSPIQREPGLQQNVIIANSATPAKVQAEDREGHEWFWLWNMLVTQLCKPVVSRHEEIVAADMTLIVKRRPVSHDRLGKLSPDHLRTVVKALPGPDSPPVQIQTHKLLCSTQELRIRLGPEEAHPITMIVGDVPNRGPAV